MTTTMIREEVASAGFDDFVQLVGDGFGQAVGTGIRVPPAPNILYRVLCLVLDLGVCDELVHLGQFATLLFDRSLPVDDGDTVRWRDQIPITTEGWQGLPDTSTTWTVTVQPRAQPRRIAGPFDQDTFVFEDSDTPALVYETAHFPAVPTMPGYLGLDAYTAPPMRGQPILSLRDVRYAWTRNEAWFIRRRAQRPERVRVYCDVVQGNPATRTVPVDGVPGGALPEVITGLPPETRFVQVFPGAIVGKVGARAVLQRALQRADGACLVCDAPRHGPPAPRGPTPDREVA
jgi:hypothetical protein